MLNRHPQKFHRVAQRAVALERELFYSTLVWQRHPLPGMVSPMPLSIQGLIYQVSSDFLRSSVAS